MKTVDLVLMLAIAAVPATYLYQKYQREENRLSPSVGALHVVRAIRFMDGMPNATQVSTDQGEFLVTRFVEIPLHAQVIVRQKNDHRVLCLAPTRPQQDLKTVPCWALESQPVEAAP